MRNGQEKHQSQQNDRALCHLMLSRHPTTKLRRAAFWRRLKRLVGHHDSSNSIGAHLFPSFVIVCSRSTRVPKAVLKKRAYNSSKSSGRALPQSMNSRTMLIGSSFGFIRKDLEPSIAPWQKGATLRVSSCFSSPCGRATKNDRRSLASRTSRRASTSRAYPFAPNSTRRFMMPNDGATRGGAPAPTSGGASS